MGRCIAQRDPVLLLLLLLLLVGRNDCANLSRGQDMHAWTLLAGLLVLPLLCAACCFLFLFLGTRRERPRHGAAHQRRCCSRGFKANVVRNRILEGLPAVRTDFTIARTYCSPYVLYPYFVTT